MDQTITSGDLPDNSSSEPKRSRPLWKWLLIGTVLLIGYFAWQCGSGLSSGARLSDGAVGRFHSQLDSASYDDIMRESDDAFRNSGTREDLLKFLTGVHSKLGALMSSARANIFVNASTNGTFIRVAYKSKFEHGDAVETFTWRKAGNDLKLVGYHVESKVFVMQ